MILANELAEELALLAEIIFDIERALYCEY